MDIFQSPENSNSFSGTQKHKLINIIPRGYERLSIDGPGLPGFFDDDAGFMPLKLGKIFDFEVVISICSGYCTSKYNDEAQLPVLGPSRNFNAVAPRGL